LAPVDPLQERVLALAYQLPERALVLADPLGAVVADQLGAVAVVVADLLGVVAVADPSLVVLSSSVVAMSRSSIPCLRAFRSPSKRRHPHMSLWLQWVQDPARIGRMQ
jgi:hypothetical protein